MTQKEIGERGEKLRALINDLSKAQDVFKDKGSQNSYFMKIKAIYVTKNGETFRHFYNEIFSIIVEIYSTDPTAIDVLGENMRILYEYCLTRDDQTVKDAVSKLFDHISLDIARIKYTNAIDRRMAMTGDTLLSQINSANQKIEEIKNTYNDIKGNVNETSQKINHAYSEFVSILGIFSAIVLVFFGGTSVIGNIIEGMKETNIFITLIVASFSGTIVFDLLFMFIYFLANLLDRGIAATNESVWWEPILTRVKIRYPIIFYTNIMSVIMIFIASILGSIQLIIKNQNDVLEWLKINLILDFTQQPVLFYTILGLIYFNVAFIFSYIISKITDFNIGRTITIKYVKSYTIEKDEICAVVVIDYDYDNIKTMPYKWMAYPYVTICKLFSIIYVPVYNVVKRIIFRYPYWFVINLLFVVFLLWMYNENVYTFLHSAS